MTTYRAGQRVRIEWPDGGVVEGVLAEDLCVYVTGNGCGYNVTRRAQERDGRTVTVLSEPPRMAEPTEPGALVIARTRSSSVPRVWVRAREAPYHWCNYDGPYHGFRSWDDLIEPYRYRGLTDATP